MATVHRSGVPFHPELTQRFENDHKRRQFKSKCKTRWGPNRPQMPLDLKGEQENRERVQAAAWFWNAVRVEGGCVYAHHHHPDWKSPKGVYGIDCSNFTSYIYNLVLGVRFTSAIKPQSELNLPRVTRWQLLRPGDLAFFRNMKKTRVSHVGIVVQGSGKPSVIHSSGGSASGPRCASNHKMWPICRFSHGFRLQDLCKLHMRRTMKMKMKKFRISRKIVVKKTIQKRGWSGRGGAGRG